MAVRRVRMEDTEALLQTMKKVEKQSDYMLLEANERKTTNRQLKQRIKSIKEQENSEIFVADIHNKIVGYLFAIGGQLKKNRHCVYIAIGILSEFSRQGIGTNLFMQMEKWAKEQNVHRLELTVVNENQAGIALYQKMGFEVEGIKHHSLKINGVFADEYYMAKLLS
ncbi:GNAT family N-acetyltransferase [Metabacillus arenae]|uniref:GNAT family N-acetyltransferase n=1 Tax=Metabacillus arenae TaxID=2771434 RepID=A0A926RXY6_9BACI|nr:GNAT family N-acetyltransferase [Metabacillus arenae]MBD1381466.1 GNAT family N-acetyltransferase [Metabacillus arenae]